MATVELTLPHHRYEIRIEAGGLSRLGEQVRAVAPHERAAVVVDEHVADTHGRVAAASLEAAGYDVRTALMPAGETNKSLNNVRSLYDSLLDARLERSSPVVAVGGGITGDTAGFVAATYLRGVPFIQAPTTLLAMVDASVGGKVGVNVPQGKNLIGAFYQPRRVIIDPDTLTTLPDREIRCGLAECVKHSVIRDPDLFHWIADRVDALHRLDPPTLTQLVERNVRIKAAVVIEDEKEGGVRAHLNFGHTFAHAIEAAKSEGRGAKSEERRARSEGGGEKSEGGGEKSNLFSAPPTTPLAPRPSPLAPRYAHGEAVALGMVAATRLAVALDRCEAGLLDSLVRLLDRLGLPTAAPDLPPPEVLLETMRLDKKVAHDRIRLILPTRLGEVVIADDVPDPAILDAWDRLRRP